MRQYLDLLKHLIEYGADRPDRTGVGTRGIFGYQMRFDLADGLPVVTTKKIHLKSVIHELLWIINGDTNTKYLNDNGVHIWDEWQGENGDLGPIYGAQWRSWPDNEGGYIDQIAKVIEEIRSNPYSRRLVVSAWNVADLDDMALAPCHCLFQFYVDAGKLSCRLDQRSCDAFLGLPFNITSYALLTHMIAQQCDLGVGELIWQGGDVHIYRNHFDQVNEQLTREPLELPTLKLEQAGSIDDYRFSDFHILDYNPWPAIKGEVAV